MADEKQKLRVLLACADSELSRYVARRLPENGKIELAGWTEDGARALELYRDTRPGLVVLDTDLFHVDGLTVASRIREQGGKETILLLSAFQGAQVLAECNVLSIDYMMRKPLKEDALYDHIRLWAAGMEEREKELSEETRFRKQVDQVFKAFDLRTDSKGYAYTVDAVCACRRKNSGLTKEIYPAIARKRDTTPANVERDIRYTVKKIWKDCEASVLERYFGEMAVRMRGRISNGRFIKAILDYLSRQDEEG
ncbi:response regulator [Agathobaculum sp. NSJ-28]|uniref:Stage 0 sporulation protein A homolog n=2 Tax=Agathobaculum TaxID=2048137 RepID=A0A923RXQ6_9FIRM|nr:MULTISPECIES: sporulation initiation factor Spo0A C-terminal domain-containing protein [Butyricicoccaceae]MBC5724605.1 response regulator [Agathobaculum faecis]MCU6788707.1 response regulator [Agathobaculum ammoniilyticum]WOC76306.1 sporulation initiation factor Spo0A C-terminal domain-containing protein [Intestinibacillus sp. NTUH-41-i26]SCI86490.1 Stage 0 sporulation protein G [uncultured Butyricicoccus sp.]